MEEPVVKPFENLLHEVAGYQKEVLSRRSRLAQLRLHRPSGLTAKSRFRPWNLWVPSLAVAAAGIVGFVWMTRPAPLTFVVGPTATPGQPQVSLSANLESVPVRFSDGSMVELNRGGELKVIDLDAEGATVEMTSGRADVSVKHRKKTHWRLDAGPFEVVVTGTRFSMEWDRPTETLTVAMSEGSVEIVGRHVADSSPIRVTAGQRFSASKNLSRWTIEANQPVATATKPAALAPTPTPADPSGGESAANHDEANPALAPAPTATTTGKSSAKVARRWQLLAKQGRYNDALDAIEKSGGFMATCRRAGAEELVQLGDVARLARRSARADQAYQLARKRFPDVDRPIFGLGLLSFEQRHDYAAAADWFATYLRKFPRGPLANEAAGREMESWQRAGSSAKAVSAAKRYLDSQPSGPYAPLARQIVSP